MRPTSQEVKLKSRDTLNPHVLTISRQRVMSDGTGSLAGPTSPAV